MRNFSNRLAFAIFIVVTAGFTATATPAQDKINEILRRMDAHNKGLTTLRAKIAMVKKDSVLGTNDTMTGKAIYAKRPGKDALVRIDWERPEESLAVKDGNYIIFRPKLNVAYTGSVKDADKKNNSKGSTSALAFMNMSRAELRANYDVSLLGENETLSNGVNTIHLQLTPKAATSYKTAELWVDVDGMPQQTRIIEKNNDTTTVLLGNIEKNVKLDVSAFFISLPAKVEIKKT